MFTVNKDCLAVTNRVVQEVEAAGMVAKRTFDFDGIGSRNNDLLFQAHSSGDCICQIVFLLVMLPSGRVLTVILEGLDNQTHVYLDAGQGDMDEQVDPALIVALYHAFFSRNSLV